MSYTELPSGPLPLVCTECGLRMRVSTVELLPLDPQTGKGVLWKVTECPMHDGGNWGTKHHFRWWRSWYHDGFKIERVGTGTVVVPEFKVHWKWIWWTIGVLLALWWLIAILVHIGFAGRP